MGYQLYREIRDHAPAEWTASERVVALMIADDANDETRRSWIKTPVLMERTGFASERGLRKVLQKIADSGFEFRMPLSADRNGRPVFAVKGRSLDYCVPRMAYTGPALVGGTDGPPSDADLANDSRESREASGEPHETTRIGGTDGPPKPIKGEQMDPVGGTDGPPLPSQSSPHKDLKDGLPLRSRSARTRRETMASQRGHASGATAKGHSDQDKIDGTRFAIAAVYGESWNKTISDEEVLALYTMKAPKNGRVTSPTAYMQSIFEKTPAFDTLLGQLDNAMDPAGADDFGQAHDAHPPCPRCGGVQAEIDPQRGICAWCCRELVIAGSGDNPSGWNVTILKAVRTALFVATGKTVDDTWAARVADHILSGKNIKDPVRYVTSVITSEDLGSPTRFLPTPIPPRVA